MPRSCSISCKRAIGAGGARDGQGMHGARARRAHSGGHRAAGEARLAQASMDRSPRSYRSSSVSAGSIAYSDPAGIDADPRQRDRSTGRQKQPGSPLLLFIWFWVDLHRLPGRRRFIRAVERAAETALGRSRRWHLFLSGSGWRRHLARRSLHNSDPNLVLNQNGRDMRAVRIAGLGVTGETNRSARSSSPYIGWYQLTPSRVLTVSRDRDRLFVQETGQPKFEVAAAGSRCILRRSR